MELAAQLFQGIQKKDYERMMTCFRAVERRYSSGETVKDFKDDWIGIVLEGKVQLLRNYLDGRQTILEILEPGDIFSRVLATPFLSEDGLQVQSLSSSRIQYMDYSHLIKRCPNACPFHSRLVDNALQMISQRAVKLSQRLEVLSQRTIRDKLLCYFSLLASKSGRKAFTLPISYSALADYLSVDRSAMMRELKKMRMEGLIETEKRKIIMNG